MIPKANKYLRRHRISYTQFECTNPLGGLYTRKSAGSGKYCCFPNLCTSFAEHVKTVLRLNVPIAGFNKLGKIRRMCLRVEIMISFFREGILSNMSSNLCCNWLQDRNKLQTHLWERERDGLQGTHLLSTSRGCIEIQKPSNIVSVGYGDGNMKCSISNTYMNYFDVLLIWHAAHVDPDKEQPWK